MNLLDYPIVWMTGFVALEIGLLAAWLWIESTIEKESTPDQLEPERASTIKANPIKRTTR